MFVLRGFDLSLAWTKTSTLDAIESFRVISGWVLQNPDGFSEFGRSQRCGQTFQLSRMPGFQLDDRFQSLKKLASWVASRILQNGFRKGRACVSVTT